MPAVVHRCLEIRFDIWVFRSTAIRRAYSRRYHIMRSLEPRKRSGVACFQFGSECYEMARWLISAIIAQ